MSAYAVYILKCADKTLYTGVTVDVTRRLIEHSSTKAGAKYTRTRRPVKLVYLNFFRSRSSAQKEEYRIKQLRRIDKLKLIKEFKKQSKKI